MAGGRIGGWVGLAGGVGVGGGRTIVDGISRSVEKEAGRPSATAAAASAFRSAGRRSGEAGAGRPVVKGFMKYLCHARGA